ncbi:hypothetical protein F5X99DRAFT_169196 [Biscogniauxia marginata]|nr:hypothetical protein F5X99DRAFT_169196 [Biscogniauxia marginata]
MNLDTLPGKGKVYTPTLLQCRQLIMLHGAVNNIKYLLQKYHPLGSLDKIDDVVLREIASGDHLWVKEYTPDIGRYTGKAGDQDFNV